jgi:cobalt-zinc-cadmium efflux system membrane fusion protein
MYNKLFFLFGISLFFLSCNQHAAENNPAHFALTDTMLDRITMDTVRQTAVLNELKFSGKITPGDNKLVNVFPVVAGYVTTINVSLGDYVKKGQVLAVIRSTDIADFEKQKRDAETALLSAQKNRKAVQELAESKLNTERDVAAADKELENAEAELRRIEEVLNIYHVNNGSFYNVIAPISGFITDKKINADMQLPTGINESIFTVAQIDEVTCIGNVYETDIAKLSTGMPVEVEVLSYPGARITGKIDKILNVLDPETKTLKIRVKLSNPEFRLKPEMAAVIYTRYPEERQLPVIPAEALVFDKSKNYLLIFHRKDSIETRLVEPDKTTAGCTWIQSGLKPGEAVITKNALLVYDALND